MEKEQEIIKTRNEVISIHRNFLLGLLTVISTICLVAMPSIPESWIFSNILLRASVFLLLLNIPLILCYLIFRIRKDLDYLDAMLKSSRKGTLKRDFDKIEKEYSWNEHYTVIAVVIFILSMVLFILSMLPLNSIYLYSKQNA